MKSIICNYKLGFTLNILTVFVIIVLYLLPLCGYAKRKNKLNFNDKTIIIKNKRGEIRTAFLAEFNGEKVVVCHGNAFAVGAIISDLNGNEMEYSSIMLPSPKLKRNILFIKLTDDLSSTTAFQLETDVSKNLQKNDKLKIYGYRKDKEKLGGGKGSVIEINDDKIILKSKIIFDITGAPVVSSKTSKVIGVALCKKTKYYNIPYAIRIDNIKEMETISKKDIEYEISRSERLYKTMLVFTELYTQLNQLIKNYSLKTAFYGLKTKNKIKNKNLLKHIDPKIARKLKKEFKALKTKLTDAVKELSKTMKSLKQTPELKIPMIKRLYYQNFNRSEEIVERKFKPKEKELEEILKLLTKRANAFK